jgi:hypothetical protein
MGHNNRIGPILGDPDWVGKLVLVYFDGTGANLKKTIPFYENPTIRESQEARISRFGPIGRAGELFAYTGAKSRQINISFNITLPHLYSLRPSQYTVNSPDLSKLNSIKEMTEYEDRQKEVSVPTSGTGAGKYDYLYEEMLPEADQILNSFQKITSPMNQLDSDAAKVRRGYINLISDYIVAIRSTVINNASNPIYGPPIVRLWFGQLYENIPCVCTSYSIEADITAGYDKRTLLPRILRVSMSLVEARNMGKYERDWARQVQRDALPGWEVIVGGLIPAGTNMDPWKGSI